MAIFVIFNFEQEIIQSKKKIKIWLSVCFGFFAAYDLILFKGEHLDLSDGTICSLDFVDNNEISQSSVGVQDNELKEAQVENLNMLLYIKNKFNISGSGWRMK